MKNIRKSTWKELSRQEKEGVLARGVHERISKGSDHQFEYECILNNIAWTRLEKAQQYGEKRYEPQEMDFNLWMCFSDVYRKFIRLEQLTRSLNAHIANGGKAEEHPYYQPLKDAYLDIANYGISGMQILTNGENNEHKN